MSFGTIARLATGVLIAYVALASSPAYAQQASGIAGLVRDTSAAVLPGVTVEASSPALIERVRTVVTDGEGRYNIVDLRPGTYTVTFTLTGFNTFRREGIQLTAGFTATVNADMQVGSLQETVTVTGASPLVDTQNVRQQKVVSSELFDALPTSSRALVNLIALTPGYSGSADVGGSLGTYNSMQPGGSFHAKSGFKVQFDGMRTNNMEGSGSQGYIPNAALVEETTLETGGVSAESSASGTLTNMIPKEGGNGFSVTVNGLFTNDSLQSSNLTDDLRARGLNTVDKVLNMHDIGIALGGPIRKDRLWFFTGQRKWGNRNQIAGVFWNKTQGTPFYTPDTDRPADRFEHYRSHAVRLTWQASPRNKLGFFTDLQDNCDCRHTFSGFAAPEAMGSMKFWPNGLFQVTWNSAVTAKFLLEGGGSYMISRWPTSPQPGVSRDDVGIVELSTGFRYNAETGFNRYLLYGDVRVSDRYAQRFSASYVTGSHAFKAGIQIEEGVHDFSHDVNQGLVYQFLSGQPVALTQYAEPFRAKERLKADLGLFIQDQWTVGRLTLNPGLRFDYFNAYVPAQHVPAGPWVPSRDFPTVQNVPLWKDLNPRFGASYNLFASGKTALKVSIGRYLGVTGVDIASANNPMFTSVWNVDRPWGDANGNYVPDCDLGNRAINGECGPMANQNFGGLNITTRYADDAIHGFGVRDYLWDFSTEVQHELRAGVSVTGGYYRNAYGNFRVTDNLAVKSGDYQTYCVTAPVNSRLPGGGGYQVCGLYDVVPVKFGLVDSLVTNASNFGEQTRRSDFFGLTVNTRLGSEVRLGGGIDSGRTVADNCFVIDSPQQLLNCHVVTPFKAQLQVKLHGSVPLPGNFVLSGVFQNVTGPSVTASYAATNAEIVPSLGRSLSGGRRTATIPLVAPQTIFEPRRNQLDLRVTKALKLQRRLRLRAYVDFYNVLNANATLTVNNTFGSQWRRPTSIMVGRLIQVGGQLNF
jgi:hypothetical protein